jgi:thiamine-monophosphate kinase
MDHLTRLLLPGAPPDRAGAPPEILEVAPGLALVVSVDTLTQGIHFRKSTDPEDLGHKALAVNLSDLAAMGADPRAASLVATLPEDAPEWAAAFARGFGALAERFGVRLEAVETGRGPLAVTIQIFGTVPAGNALRRAGARPGDRVYVTGTLGDAGVALRALLGELSPPEAALKALTWRLNRPEPRVREGVTLRGIANSAIDISDGLAADLGHILEASQAGATLEAGRLPLSDPVRVAVGEEEAWQAALASGDDYELCFTVPPERITALERACSAMACRVTAIGNIDVSPGLRCRRPDGTLLAARPGYEHFSESVMRPRHHGT